ncbi:low molecular weight protein arginine phosphatase [Bacillus sp. FJAT-42376]|uniref:low molecular weight protein arginine phosphatase n=1 Tax=Bacillus sp. FJAT-42376 TaxID=2014076 RepID=UPI000F4D907B|nr:low molecular weight protein arginine phosphatase [Bacillus sp. FJAT-42376]AZB40913.1 low molecular weight protein arginine phosphatase [Bacillus sp. FJAT-42376]
MEAVSNVLFVCTGNTCRSPMAEALLQFMKRSDQTKVKSAGVFAMDGSDASPYAKDVLLEKGIAFNHRSSLLNGEKVDWATHILTMTESHKQLMLERFPEAKEKIWTLSEYVHGLSEKRDVLDPYGGPAEIYRATRDDLEGMLKLLLEKIEQTS